MPKMKPSYSLDDLRCFCAVARHGSFKLAAQALSMPLSTLSRRIRQLENDLQLRLLNRDAHRVLLTHTGEQYYQRSAALFDELGHIDEDLHHDKHQPQGKIRISAPINSGTQFLRSVFYDFLRRYPDIQLDLNFSNSLIDIEAQGMDVVFRVGSPVVENWIARPLTNIHFVLCAHPNMDISEIDTPQQLRGYATILCRPMVPWQLINTQNGDEFDYHPQQGVRLEVDEIQMLVHGIKAELGIGYVPDYVALPMIERGEMIHVLPDWRSKSRTMFMLYRDRDNLPLRVRLFIEFVLEHFANQ
ncbi:transcriptional regulator, LysR family [Vibrio xiamenensis]|uniref:Transcriptional regulator, LysR family n=1 Tax=Vibrio xiamenensis TaxID=861298 RepID=A0A1G8GDE0_9VIBR|nr:LysR family transcriptional regulator [Vibrio xiamenensis]SDH92393.1 transcriptional regulator, LysR family [Vibrio xiamenensis]